MWEIDKVLLHDGDLSRLTSWFESGWEPFSVTRRPNVTSPGETIGWHIWMRKEADA